MLIRRNREAEQLDKVAEDARQATAARLACLLAMKRREKLDGKLLVSIWAEKALPLRLACYVAMQYSALGCCGGMKQGLHDRNTEIQLACIYGLEGVATADAVPELKLVIDRLEPEDGMTEALRILGKIRDEASIDALGAFLGAALEDDRRVPYIEDAVSALTRISDFRLPNRASERSEARYAYNWWKERKEGKR